MEKIIIICIQVAPMQQFYLKTSDGAKRRVIIRLKEVLCVGS